ncbi:hypothetical protein [Pedobacter antarcticus]|uniref:hypothetical protein n=1 Tax=Pedobacter antarcticus TaxID=34086 RepID=UPI0008865346|nr:hypothetical protein [Pedobacter antarcticus]SDM82845.1 hypothetical protein SAMN04488084_11516 [Pedobacter antarcticus]
MDRNQGDINPLTDFGETDFTDELIDFFEQKQNSKTDKNDAKIKPENIGISNNQNLNYKKMEILPNPVQVIPPNAEQKELFEAPFKGSKDTTVSLEKPKLTPEQLTSIPDVIDGHQLSVKDKYDLLLDALVVDQRDVYYFVDDKGYIMRHFTEEPTDKDKRFVNFEDVTFDMKKTQLNEQNFEYLKKSLKYLGFGENLNSALEVRLKEGSDKFTLGASAAFATPNAKDMVNYELRFSKSKTTDNYFLNDYQATLEKGNANGTVQEPVSRVFTLNKGNDITAKEAYNLLSGRSIQKNAEITSKFEIRAGFLTPAEAKVSTMPEARAKVQELVKANKNVDYEIWHQDAVIKRFDAKGKDITDKSVARENLALVHSFIHKNDKSNDDIPYDVKDMAGARQMVKELTKDKNTASLTLTEKGIPVARFDEKGKEIDLPPTKRKEEVWMKLDFEKKNDQGDFPFKTFFKNYGFDLDKAVTAHPIKELNDPDHRERLMSSLKRGNLQSVTLEKNGTEEKAFVAASPQFKNLSLYDKDLKLVYEKQQEIKGQNQEDKGYQRSR